MLEFYGFDYKRSELENMAGDFEARHGIWEDWEPWQLGMFYYTDAREFNRTLGYGEGDEEAENVWVRPVPEEKLPPVEEVEKLIDDIQSNS